MNNKNPTAVKIGLCSLYQKDRHSSFFTITKAAARTGIPDLEKLRIGTEDRMQGQGSAAVIYSMASSSKDYIANQAEWLFSSNRWNVAISRAQACAIVVGDLEAHLNAEPKSLDGIAAQQKIREVMGDENWTSLPPECSWHIQIPTAAIPDTTAPDVIRPYPESPESPTDECNRIYLLL